MAVDAARLLMHDLWSDQAREPNRSAIAESCGGWRIAILSRAHPTGRRLRCFVRLGGPIPRTAVVLVHCLFALAIELCRRVIRRRVFDSLASEIDSNLGVYPTHVLDPLRRDEHVVAAPPVARVNNQIANRPRVIVDEQIFQVAYVTVRRFDVMTNDGVATAQVAIIAATASARVPWIFKSSSILPSAVRLPG